MPNLQDDSCKIKNETYSSTIQTWIIIETYEIEHYNLIIYPTLCVPTTVNLTYNHMINGASLRKMQ